MLVKPSFQISQFRSNYAQQLLDFRRVFSVPVVKLPDVLTEITSSLPHRCRMFQDCRDVVHLGVVIALVPCFPGFRHERRLPPLYSVPKT